MKYEYRATLVDRKSKTAKNITYFIDPASWIEYARARPDEYGNIADVVESFLPLIEDGNYNSAAALLYRVDEAVRNVNGNVTFELMMYFWHGFKAGRFSSETWSAVLGYGWQCGKRGMLGGVRLRQDEVLEMFNIAIKKILYEIMNAENSDHWDGFYESLPDEMIIYRGFSTGMAIQEKGFSWTTDLSEAWKFAVLNTHTKKEVPGVLSAIIPKKAILAVCDFESEVVVNPTIPKIDLNTKLVTGLSLRKFQKKFQIGAEGRIPGEGMI